MCEKEEDPGGAAVSGKQMVTNLDCVCRGSYQVCCCQLHWNSAFTSGESDEKSSYEAGKDGFSRLVEYMMT